MYITRTSPFSGEKNTRFIDITETQLNTYLAGGTSIQSIMPDISPDDREFLITGITPQEWLETFGGLEA